MSYFVRTIYGAALQTADLLNVPVVMPSHSTLNEKFNINPDMAIDPTDRPAMRYVTIGNGGHTAVVNSNGIPTFPPIPHLPRHSALYNHLPFVLRLPSNDLPAIDRAKYRLRRLETHGGVTYVAYYARLLDLTNTVPQMSYMAVNNGVTTSTAFTPSLSDMNPTAPPLDSQGAIPTTGDYLSVVGLIEFSLSADEIAELINVSNIVYSDPNYAIISEIGVCSGVDKTVNGDFNGSQQPYTDIIGAQVTNFASVFFPAVYYTLGLKYNLNVGSTETLLVTR